MKIGETKQFKKFQKKKLIQSKKKIIKEPNTLKKKILHLVEPSIKAKNINKFHLLMG